MLKRGFDIITAFLGLIVLAPLFAIVALLIKADSPGPVLFRQERMGKGFRPFRICKFRTMTQDAPLIGGVLTAGVDPRITRSGHLLRQTKIDELPQLINVLRGDMSLVGPRPEVRRYVDLFRHHYSTILTVRPGITDLASLKYRDEAAILARFENPETEYLHRILPDKLRMAEEYIRRSSLVFDLVLIFRTFAMLMIGRNAGAGGHPEESSPVHRESPVMKPRLLFLIDEDRDFCSHRLDLARAAQDDGFEVLVATHVQHHGKQIEKEGFKLFPIRLRRGLQSPLCDVRSLIELIRLYRREQPEIVYHVALKQVLFGAIAARVLRVPVLVSAVTGLGHMFCTDGWRTRVLLTVIKPALRWGLAHPRSMVIFQNKEDCEDFVRAGIVRESQAIIIRGVGVNVSQFCPSPEPDGIPVVVLASRMLRDKGVGEFVTAAKLLKSRGIAARWVLAGMVDKENPSSFTEADLRRWESEGTVEWWGHRDDMTDVFASCHIAVLPSYGEGFPKVLLEAAACARPLIATRVRGCREIVRDGENGLLVPPKDPQALAEAILTLLHDKALRARMGGRGRDIVLNEFRAGQVAAETIAVCRGLLRNQRGGSLVRSRKVSSMLAEPNKPT